MDLLVRVRGEERGHCCFHDKGVSHPGIIVPGLEDRGDGEAGLHAVAVLLRHPAQADSCPEFVFRAHQAAGIDLGAGHVGVDIDTTGHDDLALCIDHLCRGADLVDNLAVLDGNIADIAVDLTGRVDDKSALYDNFT